jgi:hypothetical protein
MGEGMLETQEPRAAWRSLVGEEEKMRFTSAINQALTVHETGSFHVASTQCLFQWSSRFSRTLPKGTKLRPSSHVVGQPRSLPSFAERLWRKSNIHGYL